MNKRDFLKLAGLGGLAAAGTGAARAAEMEKEAARMAEMARRVRKPVYNMCGHAAGKLDTVGIAFVGVGARGLRAEEKRFGKFLPEHVVKARAEKAKAKAKADADAKVSDSN